MYELKDGALSLVDSAFLPQAAATPNVYTKSGEALIGVGTTLALLPGQPTVLSASYASLYPSFTAPDNKELRVYNFDGNKLKLRVAQATNVTTNSPAFDPRG